MFCARRSARLALPAGTPNKLVVYAPRLMPFSPQHVQPARCPDFFRFFFVHGIAAKQNVHTAAGDVCGKRHSAEPAGLRDDMSFPFMVLGVQDLMFYASPVEQLG